MFIAQWLAVSGAQRAGAALSIPSQVLVEVGCVYSPVVGSERGSESGGSAVDSISGISGGGLCL